VRTRLAASWQDLYDTAARPWRADTPVFLPYLTEERWDPSGTGTWSGLTLGHDRDDLLRSALEGVAFLLRDRLGDLRAAGHDPSRVVIGGGGTRQPAWRQLLADVLGLPLYPAATSWLSATGAARLAASVAGPVAGPVAGRAADPASAPIVPAASPAEAAAAYQRYLTLRRPAGSAGTAPGR
jgi:xylulokinase